MKCKRCSAPIELSRGNYDYSSCGLPVTLCDVQVRACPTCGERSAAIPRIEELHQAIAMAVIRKPARFTGAEVKFLRKYLGWSGVDFARHIGVQPEVVSRWENDRENIGPANDRLLRLLVANREPVSHYPVEDLEKIADESKPSIVRARVERNAWAAEMFGAA
jgi:putative zinc finger/helix-turn-helix YgiT family protein